MKTRAGDTILFSGITATVLGPPEKYLADGDPNENSLIVQVSHGTTSFLFTGDAERHAERFLIDEYGDQLRSTVLKAGHHGSDSSTTTRFLEATQPAAAVISSPYDSQYGHPNEATLQRLNRFGLSSCWTGTHGTTVVTANTTRATIQTQQSAPTDPRILRQGEPIDSSSAAGVTTRAVINVSGAVTTPVVTDGGTDSQADALTIATINADAAGDDRENLNDEYVIFKHIGDTPLTLGG